MSVCEFHPGTRSLECRTAQLAPKLALSPWLHMRDAVVLCQTHTVVQTRNLNSVQLHS
jgi:hypothetical protein